MLQPGSLNRIAPPPIRFVEVAVEDEEMDWTALKVVIAFIPGQGEVIQVGLDIPRIPVVVTQGREEAIFSGAGAIRALVGVDISLIVLANVSVDGAGFSVRVIVVANGDDKVNVPTVNQLGYIGFWLTGIAKITNHGEAGVFAGI